VEAVEDAAEMFSKLTSSRRAHAVTRDTLKALARFPSWCPKEGRLWDPKEGRLLDMDYKWLPGIRVYRMRVSHEAYVNDALCVYFRGRAAESSAFPAPLRKKGTIRIVGFCWWAQT